MRMKVRTLEGRGKTPESPRFYCESGFAPGREQLFAEIRIPNTQCFVCANPP